MNKFSVLMSVYLHSDRDQLLECLNSIINQTLQPDEVIIVKDGLLKFDLNLVISDCGIDNVIIIDNLHTGKKKNIETILDQVKFFHTDIRDYKKIEISFNGLCYATK